MAPLRCAQASTPCARGFGSAKAGRARWLREHARMPSWERRAALAMAVVRFGVVICAGRSLSRRGAAHRVGRPPLPPPLLKRPNKAVSLVWQTSFKVGIPIIAPCALTGDGGVLGYYLLG